MMATGASSDFEEKRARLAALREKIDRNQITPNIGLANRGTTIIPDLNNIKTLGSSLDSLSRTKSSDPNLLRNQSSNEQTQQSVYDKNRRQEQQQREYIDRQRQQQQLYDQYQQHQSQNYIQTSLYQQQQQQYNQQHRVPQAQQQQQQQPRKSSSNTQLYSNMNPMQSQKQQYLQKAQAQLGYQTRDPSSGSVGASLHAGSQGGQLYQQGMSYDI
ncbi:hypothetical protein SARC_16109 [Sphaeroforma arctica JP610]|uniref:Uncharacterized protein n=1 Tax=Sphaeroforma arctica JP610 TaxID=667725 RepID=A0A0L0F573_9EUKA|nr:hypothetical protein SARC_16109 [Sphaeroforma arctica JP610]KNC71353.1 hypothetical protein SARC_16109 [Sphaeroforma arctica JP610]|eukprot:XP_014145255.1 hypothetical protein SARC_16109 [Sphaeroforma arctica JP610]